jgi:hypothetical protein
VLVQLYYIAVNIFCVSFNALYLRVASVQAADLALINLILAFTSLYLSFLADLLRLILKTYYRFYRVLRAISYCLLAFYIFTILASRILFPLD